MDLIFENVIVPWIIFNIAFVFLYSGYIFWKWHGSQNKRKHCECLELIPVREGYHEDPDIWQCINCKRCYNNPQEDEEPYGEYEHEDDDPY